MALYVKYKTLNRKVYFDTVGPWIYYNGKKKRVKIKITGFE